MKFEYNTDYEITWSVLYWRNYQNKIYIVGKHNDLCGIKDENKKTICSCKYRSIYVLKNEYEYFVAENIQYQSCLINKYGDILCKNDIVILTKYYYNLKRIEKLKTLI